MLMIDVAILRRWLQSDGETALLDAREQGAFSDRHQLRAVNLPLSQLELRLEVLVPRRNTRMVWCDDGSSTAAGSLAERAASRCRELGWTDVHVLSGGMQAWVDAGGELYSGVNVVSKAFGELIEERHHTPHIAASELASLQAEGANVVVLDSRPFGEYRRMAIPHGVDCPGAELVHRAREVATDPSTLVVVNCAGRTRSIIGAQSLINAGLPNPVVALENGTMGWHLAGLETVRGADTMAPSPSPEVRSWALSAAADVGRLYGVPEVQPAQVEGWLADTDRTTYLLDVRSPEEFEQGHLAGARSAPGGQLVQATDVYVGTVNARLVLMDDDGVRATMTASWLHQLGWTDTHVLAGGVGGDAVAASEHPALAVVSGASPRHELARVSAKLIRPPALAKRLAAERDDIAVLDIGTSVKYRTKGHIPGAWWGVRSRLDAARDAMGPTKVLVLTSTDGTLAKLAAGEAARLWPGTEVLALAAGNKGWRHAGYEMEPGFDRATTEADDVWYSPYDREGDLETHAKAYLEWEVGLMEQVRRDETTPFALDH